MKIRTRKATGMALVALVLLIASVFMMMTAGAGDAVLQGERFASRTHFKRRTNYAAYGCMQVALDKLSGNLTYSMDPPEVGFVSGDPELVYELGIYNNYLGAAATIAPDGMKIPPAMVYIKAKSDFRDYPGKYTTTVYSKAYVGGLAANFGIVGTDHVDIENSVVDSWYIKNPGSGHKLYRSTAGRVFTNSIQTSGLAVWSSSPANCAVNCNLACGPYGSVASVINVTAPAVQDAACTRTAQFTPVRVPRFHPPRDPKFATADKIYMTPGTYSLPVGDYASLAVGAGVTLHLSPGKYFFANTVNITDGVLDCPGVTGAVPCDIYIGKEFNATRATINWDHALVPTKSEFPPNFVPVAPYVPLFPSANSGWLSAEEVKGPRTMRVIFVGSGAPNFKDCFFKSDNSYMALFATGKAMKAELKNNTVLWGGLKGFSVKMQNSALHYHRVW